MFLAISICSKTLHEYINDSLSLLIKPQVAKK